MRMGNPPLYTDTCDLCGQTLASNYKTTLGKVRAYHYWDAHRDEFNDEVTDALTMLDHVDEALASQLHDIIPEETDRPDLDEIAKLSPIDIRQEAALTDDDIDTAHRETGEFEIDEWVLEVEIDYDFQPFQDGGGVVTISMESTGNSVSMNTKFYTSEDLLSFAGGLERAALKLPSRDEFEDLRGDSA